MAITKTLILDSGLLLENAYIRVQGVNGNKNIASISVEVFVSLLNCESGKRPIAHMSFTFTPNDKDDALRWDKQAYVYLKTLPEFQNAIDV